MQFLLHFSFIDKNIYFSENILYLRQNTIVYFSFIMKCLILIIKKIFKWLYKIVFVSSFGFIIWLLVSSACVEENDWQRFASELLSLSLSLLIMSTSYYILFKRRVDSAFKENVFPAFSFLFIITILAKVLVILFSYPTIKEKIFVHSLTDFTVFIICLTILCFNLFFNFLVLLKTNKI